MLFNYISDQAYERVKRSKIELQTDFSGEIDRLKVPSSPLVDVHHGPHSLTIASDEAFFTAEFPSSSGLFRFEQRNCF